MAEAGKEKKDKDTAHHTSPILGLRLGGIFLDGNQVGTAQPMYQSGVRISLPCLKACPKESPIIGEFIRKSQKHLECIKS